MSRTGLAAEVPTLELCREMAAIPALAEAFKDAALVWWDNLEFGIHLYLREEETTDGGDPAPTVREMLEWLAGRDEYRRQIPNDSRLKGETPSVGNTSWAVWVDTLTTETSRDIVSPDALARACIEAAK